MEHTDNSLSALQTSRCYSTDVLARGHYVDNSDLFNQRNMKTLEQRLKESEIKYKKAFDEYQNLRDEQYEKQEKPNQLKKKGKCFVYRNNSYGGYSEKWDVYHKVIDVIEHHGRLSFIVEQFEIIGDGSVEIKITDNYSACNWPNDSWVECGLEEYETAKIKALAQLITQDKLRKFVAKQKDI